LALDSNVSFEIGPFSAKQRMSDMYAADSFPANGLNADKIDECGIGAVADRDYEVSWARDILFYRENEPFKADFE
jgi:hypothetical protein